MCEYFRRRGDFIIGACQIGDRALECPGNRAIFRTGVDGHDFCHARLRAGRRTSRMIVCAGIAVPACPVASLPVGRHDKPLLSRGLSRECGGS